MSDREVERMLADLMKRLDERMALLNRLEERLNLKEGKHPPSDKPALRRIK